MTNKVKSNSIEHYGALKRRVLSLVLDKFVLDKDLQLPDKLKAEVLINKHKLICLYPYINQLKLYLEKLDLERHNIQFKEYRHFDRRVDPYLAFLTQALVKRNADHESITPMTVEHLLGFFLQYMHTLKHSKLEINDLSKWAQFFINLRPIKNNFGNAIGPRIKELLYECSWLEPFLQNDLTKIVELMKSRAVFIPGLPPLELSSELVGVKFIKTVYNEQAGRLVQEDCWGATRVITN